MTLCKLFNQYYRQRRWRCNHWLERWKCYQRVIKSHHFLWVSRKGPSIWHPQRLSLPTYPIKNALPRVDSWFAFRLRKPTFNTWSERFRCVSTLLIIFLISGVGANCIYPLLGMSKYDWFFAGSEVNPQSIKWAEDNIIRRNKHLLDHMIDKGGSIRL